MEYEGKNPANKMLWRYRIIGIVEIKSGKYSVKEFCKMKQVKVISQQFCQNSKSNSFTEKASKGLLLTVKKPHPENAWSKSENGSKYKIY